MQMKRIGAELILMFHGAVVLFILFGWAIPSWWKAYLAVLVATAISYAIFGHCVFSKWEFDLRRQVNPDIKYDSTWLGYYAPGSLRRLPNKFWEIGSTGFVLCALCSVAYVHFL